MTKTIKLLQDKNGVTMKTGDIVKIENSFFKNHNGLYFITHSPGDPTWCSNDYALWKIGKSGKLGTGKYKTVFWPLSVTVNDPWKRAEAKEHNAKYATIETINNISREHIIEHFKESAISCEEQEKYYSYHFGEESETTQRTRHIKKFYLALAETMKQDA